MTMIKEMCLFIRRIFSCIFSSLGMHGPVWLVFFSIGLYVLFCAMGLSSKWTAIPVTLVVTGFFGWMTKSYAFRTVLREELTKIVYDVEELRKRKNLDEIRRNVSVASGLPVQIAELGWQALMYNMWNADRPYYYERLSRTHKLTWVDAVAGKLRIQTSFSGRLCSTDPSKGFILRNRVSGSVSEKFDEEPKLIKWRAIEASKPFANICRTSFCQDQDDKELFSVCADLPAGASFDVDVCWTFGQDIDHDNLIVFETLTFVQKLEVYVDYDPSVMKVTFRELGLSSFVDDSTNPLSERPIAKHSSGLLIPWNGYILTVQRIETA